MRKKRTIRRKITILLLSMVLAALFLIGAVSLWSLYSMRAVSEENSACLGQAAAEDAEEALEEMAGNQLFGTAVEKAAYIEEKFHTVISCLNGIAQTAEAIYQDPDSYPDRGVPLPVKESRELAPQLLWSERLAGGEGSENNGVAPTQEETAELLKLGNLQDMMVQYNANNEMISSIYLATASGWMLQADYIAYSKYSGDSRLPDFYEADAREWYQRAMFTEMGKIVYTDVMEDIHEGGMCIVCARPVYHNGEIVAVAGVGSYLDTIIEVVQNTEIGDSGYAFLVNERGQILVSGSERGETAVTGEAAADIRESANEELAEAADDMLCGVSGLQKLRIDDREVYLAYAPLESLGWSFAVVMDVEEVVAPARKSQQEILALADTAVSRQSDSIRRTQKLFLIILLGMAVLIGVVSILFSGKLTDPIRRLTKEVAQIDGGNLDGRIHISTGDEVEELGNAFNKMTAQIQDYIGNLKSVMAEKERIRTEIQLASRLQADMLPRAEGAFPDRKDFILAAIMVPAKGVGGDFYDFFLLDEDRLALIMADVSGKGVPAALFMVVSRTIIKSILLNTGREWTEGKENLLGEAVEEINNSLCANNRNGMFVTAWIGVLTLSTGELVSVNAGHCRPLICHRDGSCSYDTAFGGLVLAGMEDAPYRQRQLRLRQGDTLLLYTDGVTEATSTEKELYGEKRLQDRAEQYGRAVREYRKTTPPPKALLQAVRQDVDAFQRGAEQFDDITLLAVTYHGRGFAEKTGIPDMEHIREYAAFVEEYLKEKGISMKTLVKFQMAVDEIYSNICYYSGAGEVTVGVRVEEESVERRKVVLYFEDDGIPYNPLEKPDPDVEEPLEQRKAGGLGIYLVKKRMDTMEYAFAGGRNCLTLTLADQYTDALATGC